MNSLEQNFYLEKLSKLQDNFSVKIISGVRGSGKTTLLKNFANKLLAQGVADDEIIFVDCAENPRVKNFQRLYEFVSDMIAHLDRFFLLADNIDRVTDWEKTVNALFVGAPAEIYLTGSTENFAEKLSDILPENCDVLKLMPLPFAEYRKLFLRSKIANVMKTFLNAGSLPFVSKASKNVLPQMLRGLGYEIVFDLVERHSIKNPKLFRKLIEHLAHNVGTAIDVRQLCERLDFKNFPSLQKHLDIIAEAGFFRRIESLDGQTEKFYCIDNGLLRALSFGDVPERILVENALFTEILQRGLDLRFETFGKRSVNFILDGDEKIFLGVATSTADLKKFTDVLPALLRTSKKFLISLSPLKKFCDADNILLQEFLSGVQKIR